MERINCLICNGPTDGADAKIAPFLSKYCELGQDKTEIRYCHACDFAFFKRRLTDTEASRLYSNYRGDEYNAVRLSVEPSYAPYITSFSDRLSGDHITRIRDHLDLVDVYPELNELKNVLDFGGNGEIPGRIFRNSKVRVDDLSAGSTDEGIKHDLIFASNVFEHISDPVPLLESLAARLHPEGVLFVDVPSPSQASLSEGLLWQCEHFGELYEMHEHINHFSKRSLNRLVRAAGLLPVFEYKSRHTCHSILAVFESSDIAKRLIPLKEARALLYETKIVRAEARSAAESAWAASNSAADRTAKTLSDRLDVAVHDIAQQIALQSVSQSEREELTRELARVYQSVSWRITAPLRLLKASFSKLLD